ncbi:hypothetical protein TUM19329_19760 [Legionella antarctica]|uniref:Uncharacterized protein n=1 Tax=Legionella antarctica TaxID=2708020 RepID=A0A6F8T4K2_9GAMM|nr:hypothetical protein TUM19329_19760 [Legionella antarctica]
MVVDKLLQSLIWTSFFLPQSQRSPSIHNNEHDRVAVKLVNQNFKNGQRKKFDLKRFKTYLAPVFANERL